MENIKNDEVEDIITDISEETLLSLDENLELDQEETVIAETEFVESKEEEITESAATQLKMSLLKKGFVSVDEDDYKLFLSKLKQVLGNVEAIFTKDLNYNNPGDKAVIFYSDENQVTVIKNDKIFNLSAEDVMKKLTEEVELEEAMKKTKMKEAEVSSDEEFMEYSKSILKAAFGDKYDEDKAMKTAEGILKKADGDYGAAIGMLTSGLGEEMDDMEIADEEIESRKGMKEMKLIKKAELVKTNLNAKFKAGQTIKVTTRHHDGRGSFDKLVTTYKIDKVNRETIDITDEKGNTYRFNPEGNKVDSIEIIKEAKDYKLDSLSLDQLKSRFASLDNQIGYLEDEKEMKEDTASEIQIDSSDISRLVESEEGLTEEFKEKATTIFEAAVKSKIKEAEEALKESYAVTLIEEVEAIKEGMVDKIDNYLTYAVECWVEDNKVAIESSLRTEIAENFIHSLKTVFTENYIEVPENKIDLYAKLEEQKQDAENKLAQSLELVSDLAESVEKLSREKIVNEYTSELADTQAEKLKSLIEDIQYTSEDKFRSKVETIKEFYINGPMFNSETKTLNEEDSSNSFITTETIVENETEKEVSPAMKNYLTALSRLDKASTANI